MSVRVLLDNDVIIKLVAYGLTRALVDATTVGGTPPAMLGVGRFVALDRLTRASRFTDRAAAIERFETILGNLLLLEPTDEELGMAAEFEAAATRANLQLDGGESQLLAILLIRAADLLITGDKRAIAAIANMAAERVEGRLACFEQLMATILLLLSAGEVRRAVCSEPATDKALTLCCGCGSAREPTAADILAALESYINHLRRQAPKVLLKGSHISALAA